MKKLIIMTNVLLFSVTAMTTSAAISWSSSNGNWNDGSNWAGGLIPGSADIVYIRNNGTADVTNAQTVERVYAGAWGGNTGTVNIDGNSAVLTVLSNTLLAGAATGDTGTFNILNGGQLISSAVAYLGDAAGGVGIATVDGSGSIWKQNTTLYVGKDGSGTLTITDGGLAQVRWLRIDEDEDGDGVVQIGINGELAVGDNGTAATDLTAFLGLVYKSDNIDYWDGSGWSDITTGTLGTDYTLDQYIDNTISYSRLTVIPEPATLGLISMATLGILAVRRLKI